MSSTTSSLAQIHKLKIKSAIKYKIALFLNYLFNEAKSFAMFAATLALL